MTKSETIAELEARVDRDRRNLCEEECRPTHQWQERRLIVLRAWMRHSERELAEAISTYLD